MYDYNFERDLNDKGVLLDEYYTKDGETKEDIKEGIREKYCGETSDKILFAKPRKKDGIYALILESSQWFYDRFYKCVDTYCFYCHKKIEGKACNYHDISISDDKNLDIPEEIAYLCSHDCKYKYFQSLRYEGEFQMKEIGISTNTFGYIYLMVNKIENKYYIGQTRFLPFFRWQEHIKKGGKGDITDINFSVITEIKRNVTLSDVQNQEVLSNIEAWWISKYREEGYDVINVTTPRLTIDSYKKRFDEMVSKIAQLTLVEDK